MFNNFSYKDYQSCQFIAYLFTLLLLFVPLSALGAAKNVFFAVNFGVVSSKFA